jgi:hypothetical protein
MPMKKARGSKYCFKILKEGYSLKVFFTKLLDQSQFCVQFILHHMSYLNLKFQIDICKVLLESQ